MDWLHKKAFWMSLASIVDIVLKGVPPLNLESSIKDGIKYIKAYGGLLQSGVPSGYTALEYIEATGTQYIDTGILAASDIKAEIKYKPTNTSSAYCALGGRDFASGNNRNGYGIWANVSGKTRFDFQSNSVSSTLGSSTTNWNIAIKDGINNYFNGVKEENSITSTFTSTHNMYLFAMLSGSTGSDSVAGQMVGSIAYCKIWKAGVLVRDFIPAKRNSDSVIGMFDTVSNTFFTNAGTGTFAAGNEIIPTPSDPVDLVCNNGALKILDKSDWTIFTNPTSQAGQGVYVSATGKWTTADDRGAGVAIPLTIGKQYTLTIHQKTAALGTTLRFGQSPQATPTAAGVQLTDWYRGTIADGQMISFVAKLPYLVMQFSAVAVEAGMIQEAIEVLEAQGGDYTFLKYIEATGTQYIQTSISGPARWVGAGQGTSQGTGSKCILSALTTSANVYLASRFGGQATGQYWTIAGGANYSQTPTLSYAEYDIDFASDLFTGTINSETVSRSNNFTFTTWTIGTAFGTGSTQYPFVGYIYRQQAYQNNVLVGDFIPAIRNSDSVVGMYDTVSGTFFTNAGTGTFVAGTPLGDGEVLKLTPSNDTAGVANLLKLDNYVDTQEILTGLINHQLGILVLKGDEAAGWNMVSTGIFRTALSVLYPADFASNPNNNIAVCSHFKVTPVSTSLATVIKDGEVGWNTNGAITFRNDSITTLNDWKSWLATQYAAGTPVIVVYPLATAQDEVAPVPQTMQTTAGDNVLDIVQAGMDGLEVEVQYTKG